MSEDQDYEVKPHANISKAKFESEALIMLSKLEEYKKLDKMMKQYTANCKDYMKLNGLEDFKNEAGVLFLKSSNRNMLNRALIENIEKYYEEREILTLTKNAFKKH